MDLSEIQKTILDSKIKGIPGSVEPFPLGEISNKKWNTALKLSAKAKDKTLYKLVNYLYLKKSSNAASFYDYTSFINSQTGFNSYAYKLYNWNNNIYSQCNFSTILVSIKTKTRNCHNFKCYTNIDSY